MQQKRKVGRPADKDGTDKAHILKVALAAFAEFGFEGVSVSTIAKRAGVHDSLLHYHFGSKKDIWKKSIIRVAVKYDEEAKKTIRLFKDNSNTEILGKALIRHFIYYTAENIELHRVLLHELTQKTERTEWITDVVLAPFADRVESFYKTYMDSEPAYHLPAPNHLALAYGMCTTFFTMQHLIDRKYGVNVLEEALIEQHVDLVTEMVFATLYQKN